MTHIAVDMDDVLVDFVGGLVSAIETEFGERINENQLEKAGWNLHPLLDPIVGYSWWTWLKRREWLWANFPAVDGAIGGIERLRNQGHFMELVTAKPAWAEHNVWKWLGKWRPAFNRVTIVETTACKADATTADLLIDDKPGNCDHFLAQGRRAILFVRPHNRAVKTDYVHAFSWRDVLYLLENPDHGR